LQLSNWYEDIKNLYLERFCLLNEHIVGKHLWLSCLNYGPLSTHSCFSFESYYGDMIRLKSGTVAYQTAMLFTTGYQQALIQMADQCSIPNNTWQGKILEKMGVPVQIIQNK